MKLNLSDLENISEETELNVITKTEVKLNKKDAEGNKHDLGKIYKVNSNHVVINRSYTQAVNEALSEQGKEANFEAQQRNWKETKQTNAVIEKNDEKYLSVIVLSSGENPKYYDELGNLVEKETFSPYLPKSKPSSNNGGVAARTFKFSSIVSIEEAI